MLEFPATPLPRLPRPIAALGSFWLAPAATVRRLIDHGDGGVWPWLFLAEVLAAPLAWLAAKLLTGSVLPGERLLDTAGILAAFMALLFISLVGGVLLLGHLVDRRVRRRDFALALAWGWTPILPAVPLTLGLVLALTSTEVLVFRIMAFLVIVSNSMFVAGATLVQSLPAVLEAGRWSMNPWLRFGLFAWLGLHCLAIGFFWFMVTMMWAAAGLGLD